MSCHFSGNEVVITRRFLVEDRSGISDGPYGWKISIYWVVLVGGLNSDFEVFSNGSGLGLRQEHPVEGQRVPINRSGRVFSAISYYSRITHTNNASHT